MSTSILINSSPGPQTVTIGSLVQLSTTAAGPYTWSFIDQPNVFNVANVVDNLSNDTIQNPTFTARKEGTYLVLLVTNAGQPTQTVATAAVAVKQVKSYERIAAFGETLQFDPVRGWQTDTEHLLQRLDNLLADTGVYVGVAGSSGLVPGSVVYISTESPIKLGLPGQEWLPSFVPALATSAFAMSLDMHIVLAGVNGSLSPAIGDPIVVRRQGVVNIPGTIADNTAVYVSNAGVLSATPGSNSRLVGITVPTPSAHTGTYVYFNGSWNSPLSAGPPGPAGTTYLFAAGRIHWQLVPHTEGVYAPALVNGINVASVTSGSTGSLLITFTTPAPDTTYSVLPHIQAGDAQGNFTGGNVGFAICAAQYTNDFYLCTWELSASGTWSAPAPVNADVVFQVYKYV